MKMHRNFISMLFIAVVALCVLALPQTAQAADENDLTFTLNGTGDGYTVSGCDTAASGDLIIPASYNGLPVTKIGSNAFFNCCNIR